LLKQVIGATINQIPKYYCKLADNRLEYFVITHQQTNGGVETKDYMKWNR
jgi:hypothetical protein